MYKALRRWSLSHNTLQQSAFAASNGADNEKELAPGQCKANIGDSGTSIRAPGKAGILNDQKAPPVVGRRKTL